MKSNTFGLDIGATSMKVVWLSKETNGYFLQSAIAVPTPLKGMFSESPLDQEEIAKAIRKTVEDAQISIKLVNVALPESQVYTRVIEMPLLSDKELVSAIYWEAEQYIPVPLATITLDYKVLFRPEKADDGTLMQVLLVGAPTMLIDKYEKVFAMAGLTIATMETEILSTIRAITITENFPTTLIVTVGAISTSLAIVKNNRIVFAYSIPTGGIAISRAIAADFGFSLPQAEEYKKVYGLSAESLGGKIGKATEPILGVIISEVKKAITFYIEKYKNTDTIRQILLSGGSAKLPGLTTFFTKALGIETAIANPWRILGTQEVPKDIVDTAPDYTIAVGLALRDI